MTQAPPKAFISHATEDKASFVEAFARALRERGIDAWYDQWEIKAGDSLVQRIFDEGIAGARVFIIVISPRSIAKRWVAEELDAAVVQRINGGTRLIPVRLDGAGMPASLRHLKYVDADALGVTGAVDEIVSTVFEQQDSRPPVGNPPGYATRAKRFVTNPVDDAVLGAIIDIAVAKGQLVVTNREIAAHLAADGVTVEQVSDGLDSLIEQRYVASGISSLDGGEIVTKMAPRVWLEAARGRGVDIDTAYRRLLKLFSDGRPSHELEGTDEPTRDALTDWLVADGMAKIELRTAAGAFASLTVKGRRHLAQL